MDSEELFSTAIRIFNEIPFNMALGLCVESLNARTARTSFKMRDDLIGNVVRGALHGGVISSVIDATGGLAAFAGIQPNIGNDTLEDKMERITRISTIDLRVDYLRPGIGNMFTVSAYTLRAGNKVTVIRTELHNDQNDLIAVGTGSYMLS